MELSGHGMLELELESPGDGQVCHVLPGKPVKQALYPLYAGSLTCEMKMTHAVSTLRTQRR